MRKKRKQVELIFYTDVYSNMPFQSDWFLKVLERMEKEFEGEMFHLTGGYRIIEENNP